MIENLLVWGKEFIINFSYLGIFAISIVSTSTLFLPFPIYVIIFFASGLGLNPLLVGIVAGVGSALGEFTGYFIGVGGRYIIREHEKKTPKAVRFFTKFFKKYGFVTIVITSFLPFPFDFIGILSGMSRYKIKKFFLATALGKCIKTILIAYAGVLSLPFITVFIRSKF